MARIDFTNCDIIPVYTYNGANGKKIGVKYNNNIYMLKFPVIAKNNENIHYSNSDTCEYIACHIFESLGFKTQETILGKYYSKNSYKDVVACLDFTVPNKKFHDFAEIKNAVVDSETSGYGTELDEILETIQTQNFISPKELNEYFWRMFIVDSFVGNFDRHNGNWGFLSNEKGVFEIAPIFDCASCLFPSADDDLLKTCLNDKDQLEMRIYTFPNSAIKINGKKINPYEFINSLNNEDCNKALLEIFPKIDMKKIYNIIDNVEEISDIRKQFLKVILTERYSKILKSAYEKLFNTD